MIGDGESEFGLYLLQVGSKDANGSSKSMSLGHHSKRVHKDITSFLHWRLGHPEPHRILNFKTPLQML